jgi:hypothetical protein
VRVNSNSESPVPPQIPVRLQRYEETTAPPRRKVWLHPASGVFVLAVDWFFFGTEVVTLELALFLSCFLAFTITTVGVFWIQRMKSGDSIPAAAAKALFGGVIAGLPTSVGGTILGTFVLVLSGLSNRDQRRGPK